MAGRVEFAEHSSQELPSERGAHFDQADLDGADLSGARIDASTELGRANVNGCIGCPPAIGRKPRPSR